MQTFDREGAAGYLKVSSDTVRDLADSGELPGAKIGKQWVFYEDDLRAYLLAKIRQQTEDRREAFLNGVRVKVETACTKMRDSKGKRKTLPDLPAFQESAC